MANSIALATKFLPILDELYQKESVTAFMDAQTEPAVGFENANVVKVYKISTVGLGTYSRATGYPIGDVTGEWETMTLAVDRAREMSIDRMDNEETFGMAFGKLAALFTKEKVVPEVDAYRFAKYAGWSGILTTAEAVLTSGTVLAAVDAAMAAMDDQNIPQEGRYLFASYTVKRFIEQAVSRQLANQSTFDKRLRSLDGVPIIGVPQNRFYTQITLDAGATTTAGGYTKTATTGRDINFMAVYPPAVIQATKLANLKVFDPDENQTKDAWKIQYRMYHDAFVYENKVSSIYLHKKTS
jgi:hypothetical protein